MLVRDATGEMRDHFAYGESYFNWAREICQMQEGLRLANHRPAQDDETRKMKWLFDRHLQHVQGRLRSTVRVTCASS